MLKIITTVCFGDSREFWPASVSKFREKKTDLLLDTNTRHGSKNNNLLCVFWRKKWLYCKAASWASLDWNTFLLLLLFSIFILMTFTRKPFCFNWPMEWNLNCVLGERKRRVWALHMVCWKVVWALNSDTFLKNAETWWLQG